MIFSPKICPPIRIVINNTEIEKVDTYRYLGLLIDSDLKFKSHLQLVAAKVNRANGIIHAAKSIFPSNILRTLYFTLVMPHINFHLISWGGAAATHLKPIVVAQNNVLRNICGIPLHGHISHVYNQLKILPLTQLYNLRLCEFMYQSINGVKRLLSSFLDSLSFNHNYETRGHSLFKLPYIRTNVNRIFFLSNAVKLWQALPNTIKVARNCVAFKKRFTKFVFNS